MVGRALQGGNGGGSGGDAAETAAQQGYQEAAVRAVIEAERLRRSAGLGQEERLGLSRRIPDLRSRRLAGGSR